LGRPRQVERGWAAAGGWAGPGGGESSLGACAACAFLGESLGGCGCSGLGLADLSAEVVAVGTAVLRPNRGAAQTDRQVTAATVLLGDATLFPSTTVSSCTDEFSPAIRLAGVTAPAGYPVGRGDALLGAT
jgi:hypothetical protein